MKKGVEVVMGGKWGELQAENASLAAQVADMTRKVAQLEQQLMVKSDVLQRLDESERITKESYEALLSDHRDLTSNHALLEGEMEEMKMEKGTLQRRVSELEGECVDKQGKIEAYESEIASLSEAERRLSSTLTEHELAYHNLYNDYAKQLDYTDRLRTNIESQKRLRDQKDRHIATILKEKDKLYRQVTQTRVLLSNTRNSAQRVQRAAYDHADENHPSAMSARRPPSRQHVSSVRAASDVPLACMRRSPSCPVVKEKKKTEGPPGEKKGQKAREAVKKAEASKQQEGKTIEDAILRLQRESQAAALENRRLKSCLDKERTRQTVNQQTFGALQEENRSLREQLTSNQGSINAERK
ncbi:unnamed protein product [Vitrella brassicaformis CCMP3155]|uniref:Uncharacterized protein n=1 Tax=Vitrella brassicaformis (strain CCMP3155) TaxID=1169540 RepID=A0A0G4F4K3_VITBC|nr:unnamed protein product [Vitrella brassicaformis CCMP3155]|eukprot:CEM06987.1 unnamed protein product [Vitrella brassicaformis CCMP3155]